MQMELYQISRVPKQAIKSYEKSKAGVARTDLQHISSAEKKLQPKFSSFISLLIHQVNKGNANC